MLSLAKDIKIYIYHRQVDMRKSINGLVLLIVEALELDPQANVMYLFHNKAGDKFKSIFWDGDGFILLYKRKEKGRFKFPKNITDSYYEIDADLFNWLRKGFDFYALKQHPELKYSEYY